MRLKKFISVDLQAREIKQLDLVLGTYDSSDSRHLFGRLRATLHDRFTRLSSWFQVPEGRIVAATVREVGDLVAVECEQTVTRPTTLLAWTGDAIDLAIRGSSVHRLYDCLFVLVHNALRDGDASQAVQINADVVAEHRGHRLQIAVTSAFASEEKRKQQVQRLTKALAQAGDLSAAMGREGYSGIRKLLFLTSEGRSEHTVEMSFSESCLVMRFSISVELGD